MPTTSLSQHDVARRREQLEDLSRYLRVQESEFEQLHAQVSAFRARYIAALADLYLELDALEFQLHASMTLLAQALERNGVALRLPPPPRATTLTELPQLPPHQPPPPQPSGALVELAAPSLKTLYRRAARRLHPDLAGGDGERAAREQQMMGVNAAYADADRARLEALLLAAGEPSERVLGGNANAMRHWLGVCERAVQGRTRVVQAHRLSLQAHVMHRLWVAVEQGQRSGLDPLSVMASRLRTQIAERRQELYIGQRLQPGSQLAADFLHQRCARGSAIS